jgi:hypothetical protein
MAVWSDLLLEWLENRDREGAAEVAEAFPLPDVRGSI